jgi:uncharacterized YigZ family protein
VADPSRYPVPVGVHRVVHTVRRSRFVTTVTRAADDGAAHAFIAGMREEFPDATHHCWAFVAGPPGDSARVGMSDDGEPHGTAGRPMLTVLLHSGVGEVVAVCARYFGGVKLGTGGLSRAYADAMKQALETLPLGEKVDRISLLVTLTYADVDAFRRLAEAWDAVIEDESFAAVVSWVVAVPSPDRVAFEAAVADATQGRGRIEACGAPPGAG